MAALGIGYRPRTRYRGLIATLLLLVLGCVAWWWLARRVPASSRGAQSPASAAARTAAARVAAASVTTAVTATGDGGAPGLLTPPSAPLGRTLDRAYSALGAAARPCAAKAAPDANPAQRIRHHVRVDHGRVTNLQRVDGDMAGVIVDCIEQRWRAARWNDDDQPRTVTLEMIETLDQLRHGR